MNATTTFLITPFCPLNCRYCNLAEDMDKASKKEDPNVSYEEMVKMTEEFLKDNQGAENYTITLTGGEPFLRWPDIKKLIEKFPEITWEFNTSGYLLNDEIIKFLSKFHIRWNLSVDGGEKVTNYLRPLRNSSSNAKSYFEKLKEIVPTLTYYFPNVYCKVIISKRLISELYNSWLELERLGFKRMFVILDFTEREDEKHGSIWTDEDFIKLQEQFNKIAEQLYIRMKRGQSGLRIIQFDEVLAGLLNPQPIGPYNLLCDILQDRSINGIFQEDDNFMTCYAALGCSKEAFENRLKNDFKEANEKCVNDPNCPYFNTCARRTCVRDNIVIRDNAWAPEWAFCKLEKICGNSAVYLLDLCNRLCPDAKEYHYYLSLLQRGEVY